MVTMTDTTNVLCEERPLIDNYHKEIIDEIIARAEQSIGAQIHPPKDRELEVKSN